MTDEDTQPNPKVNNPRSAIAWLMRWSQNHTIATAAILGFLSGWLLPKILG